MVLKQHTILMRFERDTRILSVNCLHFLQNAVANCKPAGIYGNCPFAKLTHLKAILCVIYPPFLSLLGDFLQPELCLFAKVNKNLAA